MRKGVTFISAALTAFILAMLAGVVYAYNNGLSVSGLFSQQASNSNQSVSLPLMAPTASAVWPRDAAAEAAKFMNRTDLYSVQLATYNGQQSYEVTFASGAIAYVSMSGQVLGIASPTQAPAYYSAPNKGGGGAAPQPSLKPIQPPSQSGDGGGHHGGGGDD